MSVLVKVHMSAYICYGNSSGLGCLSVLARLSTMCITGSYAKQYTKARTEYQPWFVFLYLKKQLICMVRQNSWNWIYIFNNNDFNIFTEWIKLNHYEVTISAHTDTCISATYVFIIYLYIIYTYTNQAYVLTCEYVWFNHILFYHLIKHESF